MGTVQSTASVRVDFEYLVVGGPRAAPWSQKRRVVHQFGDRSDNGGYPSLLRFLDIWENGLQIKDFAGKVVEIGYITDVKAVFLPPRGNQIVTVEDLGAIPHDIVGFGQCTERVNEGAATVDVNIEYIEDKIDPKAWDMFMCMLREIAKQMGYPKLTEATLAFLYGREKYPGNKDVTKSWFHSRRNKYQQ